MKHFAPPVFALLLAACPGTVELSFEWEEHESMPNYRYRHAAAATMVGEDEHRIFMIGGIVDGPHEELDVAVDAFDPVDETWDPPGTYPDMPTRRGRPAVATAPDGKIYVIGGWTGPDEFASSIDVLEPHPVPVWSTIPDMPTARQNAAAIFDEAGRLYVIGGESGSGGSKHAQVERYDPNTTMWETLDPLPLAATGLGVGLSCVGNLVVVGAREWTDIDACVSRTFSYNIEFGHWTQLAPMPVCLGGRGVVHGPDDRIYVVNDGNYFAKGEGDTRVYSYDSSQDEWRQEPDTNLGGTHLAAAAAPLHIFAFGGTGKFSSPASRVESLFTGQGSICPGPVSEPEAVPHAPG